MRREGEEIYNNNSRKLFKYAQIRSQQKYYKNSETKKSFEQNKRYKRKKKINRNSTT